MTPQEYSQEYAPTIERLRDTLRGIRSGRAQASLVEGVTVPAYGSPMKLGDVATIGVPDAKTIQIEPWDPAFVSAIDAALRGAGLGMTPSVTGTVLRLSMPPLTEERRHELVKLVRKNVEEIRVMVRTLREKHLKELKKQSDARSEDDVERERGVIQKEVDRTLEDIRRLGEEKETDILSGG